MAREVFEPVDLDDRVFRSFRNQSQYFIHTLGEPTREGYELCFPVQNFLFKRFTIRYEIEKKFLGKIYVMVLEACCLNSGLFALGGTMELRYSGFFKKKEPLFVPLLSGPEGAHGRELSQGLNRDSTLLEACHKLEIESLKVVSDPQQGAWKIQVRPFGGAYVHLLFPPVRYPVLLPRGQAESIFSVMHRIAQKMVDPIG